MAIASIEIDDPTVTAIFTATGPLLDDSHSSVTLSLPGFGITAGGRPYYDPAGADPGDQADVILDSSGVVTLQSRTRVDPVEPDHTLIRKQVRP